MGPTRRVGGLDVRASKSGLAEGHLRHHVDAPIFGVQVEGTVGVPVGALDGYAPLLGRSGALTFRGSAPQRVEVHPDGRVGE